MKNNNLLANKLKLYCSQNIHPSHEMELNKNEIWLHEQCMHLLCIYPKRYKLRALEAKIIMKVILSVIFVLQCRGQKRMCPLEGYMLGRQE